MNQEKLDDDLPFDIDPNLVSKQEVQERNLQELNADQLSNIFVNWHVNAVNQGRHVLNINNDESLDGMIVAIDVLSHIDEDGKKHFRKLEPDEIIPFKHGIQYMLKQIENLPFRYIATDADGKPYDSAAVRQLYTDGKGLDAVEPDSEDSGS